jgi:hypothetical protein
MTDQQYPEASQATTALVLGIVGLVACWVLAPVAWVIGRKEVRAIDAGLRPPENRSSARAGQILGIIGTVILVLAVPAVILAVNLTEIDRDEEGNIIETGTLSVYDLEVGDCGDWPDDMEVYLAVTVRPCDTAHDFEVYHVSDMPDGPNAVFPGDAAIVGFAEQACLASFEDYVGIAWEDALDLGSTYLHPSEDTWAEGDREVTCTLSDIKDGVKLVGSMENSG